MSTEKWTLGGLIEAIRADRQMSKAKRAELVAIAESIEQPSAYPASVTTAPICWMIRNEVGETHIDENCLWLDQANADEAATIESDGDPDHTYTAFPVFDHAEPLVPSVEQTIDTLLLLGSTEHITDEMVATWSDGQRLDAVEWAIALHYKASDNDDVVVPKRPAHTIEVPRV